MYDVQYHPFSQPTILIEQKELVEDFEEMLKRQNKNIRISGVVLVILFAFIFCVLDVWRPKKWHPDVAEDVRDVSAFQQIVEATCYGDEADVSEVRLVLALVVFNLLCTGLFLLPYAASHAKMAPLMMTLGFYLWHSAVYGGTYFGMSNIVTKEYENDKFSRSFAHSVRSRVNISLVSTRRPVSLRVLYSRYSYIRCGRTPYVDLVNTGRRNSSWTFGSTRRCALSS